MADWFETEEWQAGELQADEDILMGNVEYFENDSDFFATLDKKEDPSEDEKYIEHLNG